MSFSKIDEHGHYQSFQGLSVVSHCGKDVFWHQIHTFLREFEDLAEYFSPLKPDSYHMTAFSLYNQNDLPIKKWLYFVQKQTDFHQKLMLELQKKAFTPSVKIRTIILNGVIQLIVKLPEEQQTTIRELAQSFGLETKIGYPFHITLAYQYKSLAPEKNTYFQTALTTKLVKLLTAHPQDFLMHPPQLCYFNDMTAFIPWERGLRPFETPGLSDASIFTSSSRPKEKTSCACVIS